MELLTTDQLARALKVSRRWIQAEVQAGRMPHMHLGRSGRLIRFDLAAVLAWLHEEDAARKTARCGGSNGATTDPKAARNEVDT